MRNGDECVKWRRRGVREKGKCRRGWSVDENGCNRPKKKLNNLFSFLTLRLFRDALRVRIEGKSSADGKKN